jgi:hypothetical protein
MAKQKVADGIFLVRFETQYALAATFLRIQEHFESSRFHNRVFTLEEYMDWYAARFGAFTYFEDWEGFNVPSTAFDPFYEGDFDPLLQKEKRLLQLFERERRPFYVIGVTDDTDLQHEFAHALFFMRPAYRRAVLGALRGVDTQAITKQLAGFGYHRSVLTDEVHAYLLSRERTPGLSIGGMAPLRRQLRAIYDAHAADVRLR